MSENPRARRKAKNTFTTRSGKTIKINRSLSERIKAGRDAKARRKAAYLSTLPKDPIRRLLFRMQPRRLYQFWFSRDGAIMALKITGVGLVFGFILLIGLFAYFRKDLPKIKSIDGTSLGGSITYYDRTGKTVLWQDYDAVKRFPVQSNQINNYMKEATVAIEDRNFYHEGAFDIRSIIRAAVNNLKGNSTQGASTITEQLVKLNEGWVQHRTIGTKVKELILAVELERQYSKSDILTGYLNIAPYGGVDYGVESAARDYFGVSASQLTLPEAAMLASIPKAPGAYSPYSSPKFNSAVSGDYFDQTGLIARQHYVLDQMASQGYITQQQADAAKKVNILAQVHKLQTRYSGIKAPYFVLAAKQELEDKYGAAVVNRGGWKVDTTLDLHAQDLAENLVKSNWSNIQWRSHGLADEEATVAEDVKTGQIVALVGGVNFSNPNHGQNNYAAGILIPPGSSFKPYDYSTFINNNNNVGAGSVLYDSQTVLPGYPCTNHARPLQGGNCLEDYDFLYPGPEPIRYALGGSRNVPAVKAMLSAVPNDNSPGKVNSINKVISTATAMMDNPYVKGNTYNCYANDALTIKTQCYGASAIGDGAFLHLDDHVNGLATLARMGNAIPRTFILKITNSTGKTVYQWTQPKGTQVIKKDTAYIVDNMLDDPNASYLPGYCTATNCYGYKFHRYQGWDFAIKTGTTNDGYDGLMTSWSTKYAVVSWVGNHNRNQNISKYGSSMEYFTEPLTEGMMKGLHKGLKPVNWKQPSDIKVLPAFVLHKHIHYGDVEPSPSKDLFPSWYIGGNKGSSGSETIDKVSGKLATSCTPSLAKQTSQNTNANTWNVDLWAGGSPSVNATNSTNTTQTTQQTDDVHKCSDNLPSVSIPSANSCDNQTKLCSFTVTAVQGSFALSGGSYTKSPAGTLSLLVNGHEVKTIQIPTDSGNTFSYTFDNINVNSDDQVTAQVVDSVLYSSTSGATQTPLYPPATSGSGGTGGGAGGAGGAQANAVVGRHKKSYYTL